jgi:methyl-accepting chemotaxis protein
MDLVSKLQRTDYYGKMNFQFLWLLWLHLPISLFTAYLGNQSLSLAVVVSLLILSMPSFLIWHDRKSLEASIANGVALVSFSALLIHLSGGMTELHFHIFASLGLMITLAQSLAVLAALIFVLVHHVSFFFFLPKSLINYDASFGVLVIHAIFALSIGIPAFFISRKFKIYIVGVKEIVDEIQNISSDWAEASSSMLQSSKILSDSTQKEASAIQQTAVSLEELRAIISKNSGNAENVAKNSESSKNKSDHGLEVMSKVVSALGEIQGNSNDIIGVVNQSNQSMEQIIHLIKEIGTKTKVINEIVFQTKLLSFNASVEAARAGEHGKGFAVVAEEVGNLARMSGSSAKDISDLLEKSIAHVQSIIEKTKEDIGQIVNRGQSKIENGLHIAEECKVILSDIDTSLNQVSEIAEEIATASKEQTVGVSEITHAMSEVEKASQQNSSVSNSTTEIASHVAEDTQLLNDAIDRLVNAVEKGVLQEKRVLIKRTTD